MDKNQTNELINSFKLILIGIIFWVVKPRYVTYFLLDEFNVLNIFGFEIIGTILIMIGLIISRRIYPFVYLFVAEIFIYLIFVLNLLEFFLFKYKIFQEIQSFLPFLMSLTLVFISKILENGLKYFKNVELSRKWKNLSGIILFGIALPYYLFNTFRICGFIKFNNIEITSKVLFLSIPALLTVAVLFLLYLRYLILSFRYLVRLKKEQAAKEL
ncbi:MAG TPA: hypothetical protein PK385_00915 [Spirochaetota bacterium]|jgi:hypothetical protein|nr:MAG: hypothetical protein BWX91_00126 [Spirochaetes bacterium ADurb.Bin133]HNZ25662.1 hypothetical protein [Spirochaetota bacterium]HOF00160.1 hypothetical protein [Spirochaetota bacterium]HOS32125.1 hypothetical protein [Spirochaetota bacterium]HOS54599.1 hypothetical protein [Spirochaetota bacterium]